MEKDALIKNEVPERSMWSDEVGWRNHWRLVEYKRHDLHEKTIDDECGMIERVKLITLRWFGQVDWFLDEEITKMVYGNEVKGPERSCNVYVVDVIEGRPLNAVKSIYIDSVA